MPGSNQNFGDSFAQYIGVSAPEVPKYLLLNNFLSNYFQVSQDFSRERLVSWEANQRIFTQENDPAVKETLLNSFAAYFDAYSGFSRYGEWKRAGNKVWVYPVIPSMITTTEQYPLRHLLYTLQQKSSFTYEAAQTALYDFLYRDQAEIHQIFRYLCGPVKSLEEVRCPAAPSREFGELSNRDFFMKLAKRFGQMLEKILHDRTLLQADFYTRMEFLSDFLVLSVMKYLLERTNDPPHAGRGARGRLPRNCFLCKGSTDTALSSGPFHKACVSSYSCIRSCFSTLMKRQYEEMIEKVDTERFTLRKDEASDGVLISYGEKDHLITEPIIEFLTQNKLSAARESGRKKLPERYRQLLGSEDKRELNKADFTKVCFDIRKSFGGSTMSKISSVLSTMGREINFVFPRNRARQKYFALSEEMTIFLVRLFLILEEREYAHYDDFINWLGSDFSIYLGLDAEGRLKQYLQEIGADVPTDEFNRNERAFLETLQNVNCAVKLSDSGYLVILPEKKGGFRLL